MSDLAERAHGFPTHPGVYLFRDGAGRVLYVGKARSLRERVRAYFQPPDRLPPRIRLMVAKARDLECIATDSEVEALILECNLIKRHRPPYNVQLRDDKHYPYLRLGAEEFSRLTVVRSMQRDGARYFGPYVQVGAMRETLRLVRRVFPVRTCGEVRFREAARAGRPCLDYHLKLCLAPCVGLVAPQEYRGVADQLAAFLEGRGEAVVRRLRAEMEGAAAALDFERAALLRDRLRAVEQVTARQKMVSAGMRDQDVVGLARRDGVAVAQVFTVRAGKLVGREGFTLTGTEGWDDTAVQTAFLKQYYTGMPTIPRSVFLQVEPEEPELLREWLRGLRGGAVELRHPRRGPMRALVELARQNAELYLEERHGRAEAALDELRTVLELPEVPRQIEGFDVSNLQGTGAVASCVSFRDGKPHKDGYRRLRIREVAGQDDFRMLAEAVQRRYREAQALPDLVLVDGGRGQLSAVRQAMEEVGVSRVPTWALAKEEELLFSPDRPEPLRLPRSSPALRLLQQVRDEAHRFAVGYHRKVRDRQGIRSLLDEVPGIGPRRRKALLQRFGTLEAIRAASEEELAATPGMNRRAARELKAQLGG